MVVKKLDLLTNQKNALQALKKQLIVKYPVEDFIIFGSVARGEDEEGSDLDVLVLTSEPISHRKKHIIYGIVTDINLVYDTNISILILDKPGWEHGIYSVLSIKDNVKRDGVSF